MIHFTVLQISCLGHRFHEFPKWMFAQWLTLVPYRRFSRLNHSQVKGIIGISNLYSGLWCSMYNFGNFTRHLSLSVVYILVENCRSLQNSVAHCVSWCLFQTAKWHNIYFWLPPTSFLNWISPKRNFRCSSLGLQPKKNCIVKPNSANQGLWWIATHQDAFLPVISQTRHLLTVGLCLVFGFYLGDESLCFQEMPVISRNLVTDNWIRPAYLPIKTPLKEVRVCGSYSPPHPLCKRSWKIQAAKCLAYLAEVSSLISHDSLPNHSFHTARSAFVFYIVFLFAFSPPIVSICASLPSFWIVLSSSKSSGNKSKFGKTLSRFFSNFY